MTRKLFEYGGWIAGAVLIVFGIVAIGMGVNGRNEVRDAIAEQKIVATDDAAEITGGKLQPGEEITTGSEAKQFANIMEFHALESSGGLRYAEMGRYVSAADPENKAGTSDEAAALKDEQGNPVPNRSRDTWVTQTALSTALNVSYMAEQLALFGIVVGVALLLTGIGFLVLAIGGALQHTTVSVPSFLRSKTARAAKG